MLRFSTHARVSDIRFGLELAHYFINLKQNIKMMRWNDIKTYFLSSDTNNSVIFACLYVLTGSLSIENAYRLTCMFETIAFLLVKMRRHNGFATELSAALTSSA